MINKYATIWQYKFDNGKLLNLVGKGIKKRQQRKAKSYPNSEEKIRFTVARFAEIFKEAIQKGRFT